jgi:rRNA maturation endonuclease Nob1
MQYLRCEDCGATYYTARQEPAGERCAECGGELSKDSESSQPGGEEDAEPRGGASGS